MRKCKSWMDPAHSLDADWPPHQSMTIADLVADARAVEWNFTTWCYASGYEASNPDARHMFECLLAGRGAQRLELTGTSKLAEDSMRCPPLGGDGCFEAPIATNRPSSTNGSRFRFAARARGGPTGGQPIREA